MKEQAGSTRKMKSYMEKKWQVNFIWAPHRKIDAETGTQYLKDEEGL